TVDGKTVTFDQGPVMVDGVLFVPVRAIAEAAGGGTHDQSQRLRPLAQRVAHNGRQQLGGTHAKKRSREGKQQQVLNTGLPGDKPGTSHTTQDCAVACIAVPSSDTAWPLRL
ncbi:MAG: hypothetical protein JWN15_2016, partial [Firmicutes bacterium]|nr:hypothetical protein [Bacillota bacterium]